MNAFFGWLALVPLFAAWFGCLALARRLGKRGIIEDSFRLAWIFASVLWATWLVFLTELASAFTILNRGLVFAGWSASCVVLVVILRTLAAPAPVLPTTHTKIVPASLMERWRSLPWDARAMFLVTGLMVVGLGLLSVLAPTTNYDSLTYHMPRVMHWIQNGSVDPFPTGNSRQNEFGPFSGYVIAHLHLLQGSDRLATAVQWFSMVGCLMGGTWMTGALLGRVRLLEVATRHRVSAFCALLIVSLPIGLVEAATTQTDYNVAFWYMALACWAVLLWRSPGSAIHAAGAALTLGLGVLTKATMLIYAFPLMLVLYGWLLWQLRGRQRLLVTVLLAVGSLAVTGPYLSRNLRVYGGPLGSGHIMKIESNAGKSVGTTFSNVIRNISLHTNTGLGPVTDAASDLLKVLHHWSGKSPNDSSTTYYAGAFAWAPRFFVTDSYASCFFHLLLALAAAGIALVRFRLERSSLICFVVALIGFLLFCTFLRWQQWHSRIHLPWFVFVCPAIAVIIGTRLAPKILLAIAVVVAVFGIYSMGNNLYRPVFSRAFWKLEREEQYLFAYSRFTRPGVDASNEIVARGARSIGLKIQFDDPEYPFWILLRNRGYRGTIHHVLVEDASRKTARVAMNPDVVLTTLGGQGPPGVPSTRHGDFTLFWMAHRIDSSRAPAAIDPK